MSDCRECELWFSSVFDVGGSEQEVSEYTGHDSDHDAFGFRSHGRCRDHSSNVGAQLSQRAIEGSAFGEIMGGSELGKGCLSFARMS